MRDLAGVLAVAAFMAAVAAVSALRPDRCSALYLGTAVYAAFLAAAPLARWSFRPRAIPLALAAYLLALLAAGALASLEPIGRALERVQEAQQSFLSASLECPGGRPLVALNLLTLAPLVEESLFRGILFSVVQRRLGTPHAYLASSLAFSLAHGPSLAAVPLFVVSLALAFAYHRGGLPTSIAVHLLQNAAASALLWR